MDARKKILLGDRDVKIRDLEDFYLDVNLSGNKRELWPNKYDNVFDINTFYQKERNESRNFIIYGIVDSYFCDCNNLLYFVYNDLSLSENSYLTSGRTFDIVNENMPFKNIYNKKKGKYLVDEIPITFTGYSVYIKFEEPSNSETNITEEVQLIYTTLTINNSGEKVVEVLDYGLNETVVDCDGNIIEINNDFDFFYNKHWIKKDVAILNTKTEWVGCEDSKSCEISNVFDERIINGGYFTGNYIYNQICEIYSINGQPTGNIMPNLISSENYIAPINSDSACPKPKICLFAYNNVCLPADGNLNIDDTKWNQTLSFTQPPYQIEPNAEPSNIYIEGESLSGTNLINSDIHQFLGFTLTNTETFNGQTNLTNFLSTTNDFQFGIYQNTQLTAVFKELCPYTIRFILNYLYDSNNHLSTFYPIDVLNTVFVIEPTGREFYYAMQPASIKVEKSNSVKIIAGTLSPYLPVELIKCKLNGVEQNILNGNYHYVNLNMNTNVEIELFYTLVSDNTNPLI
jgi:hypothetical protein